MEETVRIVVLDFYMASPIPGLDVTYSEFRGNAINQVPILRCFGSTKSGQKICVHIHGVFPYLYIPYDGTGNAENLMYQIASSIDKAVNTSLNQGSSSTQYVYKISLVSGIPMYGYHPKQHQFFKVYLYNPMLVSTVTNLLLNRSILDRVFQPHEAHVNFTLQFMIDYNLHGMSNMVISSLKYRLNPDNQNSDVDKEFLPASIERITLCELEGDVNAENILNRQDIINGSLAVNPGIAALWADEKQRRRNKNEDSQLGPFLDLKNMKFTPTKTHLIFQQALAERLAVLSTDKDIPKEEFNLSVYPAETPNNARIQNASLIDIHTPSSLELSLDDTINASSSQNLDDTITSTQGNSNVTMDEDANNFLKLLEQLAEEKVQENTKEEDSILSQTIKEDDVNNDSIEDFLDLSMPLAAVTTPRKVATREISKSDDEDTSFLETTLIPQVDGQIEMSDSENELVIVENIRSKSGSPVDCADKTTEVENPEKPRCDRSLPLLDINFNPSDLSASPMVLNKPTMIPTVKLHRVEPVVRLERLSEVFQFLEKQPESRKPFIRKTPEEKLAKLLHLIRFRIDRLNFKSKVKRVVQDVRKKEMILDILFKKLIRPKFNITSGTKWYLDSSQNDVTTPIISRLIKQTHNYTDPALHMLVRLSNQKLFLYCYGGKNIPAVTEIPSNLSDTECIDVISESIKSDRLECTKTDPVKRQKMKIFQNKILNIKEPKQRKQKNAVKSFIKKEASCEIAFVDLPHKLLQVVVTGMLKTESKLELDAKHCTLEKEENIDKVKILEEVKQANLALEKHVQQLNDFDIFKPFNKEKINVDKEVGVLSSLKCFNDNNSETNRKVFQASTFSYETEAPSELPSSQEVNNILTEIKNFNKNASISSRSILTRNQCHLRILNSYNYDFDAKENVSNDPDAITLHCSELQNHEEFKELFDKEENKLPLKILSDIGNNNCETISHFENLQCKNYLPQTNPNLKKRRRPRRPNFIDSSSESDNNSDTFIEDSQLINSRQIPVACNLAVIDTYAKLKKKPRSSTSDSDYMSLSLSINNSERNISFELDSSPSKESHACLDLYMGSNKLLKSFKAHPRINIISDVLLEKPSHAHSLQRSSSSGVVSCNENIFENGEEDDCVQASDIVEPYQFKSQPQWDHTYNHPYISKNIKRRRQTTPNMYINCDGAVDSSSEDEKEKIKTRSKRKAKRRRALSQYAPLQILVSKSPRVQENCVGTGLADNLTGIAGHQTNFPETSSEVVQKKSLSKSSISFKRKLNFESGVSFNKTTSEEFISCAYSSPKNISKSSISATVTNDNTFKISEKSDGLPVKTLDTDFDQKSNNSQSANESTSHLLESTFSDSDLFSENEDMNRSFFRNYNLSTSEKYDKETKYRAKEGCSTVFTPSSILSQGVALSQKSQVSSDDTSKDITPNQEAVPRDNRQTVTSGQSSGDLGSDITPYQNLKQLSYNQSEKELSKSSKSKILKPAFCAPTRLEVEASLNKLKIAEVIVKEPFYSNVEDYTGVVEVGQNTLRIPSKTTSHLLDFDSEFNGLTNYRKSFTENVANLIWNFNNLKSLKLNHCNNRNIIIRPIKKAPLVNIVQKWLEDNSKEILPLIPKDTNTRSKIYIPNSPGDDQDDLELSLSVTPCTPVSQQSKTSLSSEPGAHRSSLNSQNSSPILDHRKKKCKKKASINRQFHLRESFLSSEDINKSCQITGISQNDTFGFSKSVQNLQAARVVLDYQHLTTMVMELHIRTRGDLRPDPEYDPICAIFYSILNDVPETYSKPIKARGVVALNCLPIDKGTTNDHFLDGICIDCDITYAETEEALINTLLSLIEYWNPDIFAGYEIQMLSWGYLIDRAFVLSMNIIPLLGRSQINKYGRARQRTTNYEIETAITGRIVLDVWRIMKHEIALQSYTFESIVYHILHKRTPLFMFKDLTFWWDHRTTLYRHRVVSYYLLRVETVLELFDKLDFLNRTSELARLFGILFYEVLSRGSQFRVESMMLRLAKPLNYVPVSPSQAQRAKMKAPEYIALVMEPESKLYNDPVIVLDFQSLYPSIIIAYNYCFTTCIGRVNSLGTNVPYDFGATQLKVSKKLVEKLSKRNLLNYSPGGVAFVKQKVRQGILPRMLTEILDTRLMVKNSMKENKGNENLQKVLHNRQLGLKLIANVTYGYTAANFSGRMCCVEVGDSVVSKARETLQRAIALVESTTEWGARIVYGDTDSLFVLVPGRTRETAFEIGKQIADAITNDNPDPVKLKLEKVYQPCILQTKKRYVGYMYESPDQKEPVYDAKGIETVRRDGCPAVSKMLQKCLTLLFETKDVSLIKKYILKQFNKIQAGRASIQDLTFAKEYRGASGYKPGACVPALELARKWQAVDRRSEPRSGERVPYIIVNGPPGLPLIRLVRSPRDLLSDSSLRPNSLYYITKVIIPPINRCFNLIGADLHTWFNQMPRKNTQYLPNSSPIVKSTISQYFVSKICASCCQPTQNGLCDKCCQNANSTAFTLVEKLRKWEENFHNTKLICHSCTGHLDEIACISLDCPVLYRRTQTYNELQQSTYVRELLASTDIFSENSVYDY